MNKSGRLGTRMYRAVDRTVGECSELWSTAEGWQTHALQSVCKLTDSRVGLAFEATSIAEDGRLHGNEPITTGWLDDGEKSSFLRHQGGEDGIEDNSMSWVEFSRQFQDRWTLTRARQYLVDRVKEDNSAWYSANLRPTGLGDCVYSAVRMPATNNISLWLIASDRSQGQLELRSQRLIHQLHLRVAERIGRPLSSSRLINKDGLSRRQLEVLALLLEGQSEATIAKGLHRSSATVHEHIDTIYRHFSVGTRAELLGYFIRRRPKPRSF